MATIPQHLRDRLREAKVIPFVGAGVSMAVRRNDGTALFPSWKELLERGADRLHEESKTTPAQAVRKLLASADHLAAAECLRENLGTLWTPFLRDQLDPKHEDADDHSLALARTIWALGSKLILTTNFDCVLHWSCPEPHVCAFWDVASAAEKAQLLADGTVRKPTVWHLHGRIDNAANLVLTPELYDRLYAPDADDASGHRAARETLRQVLASRTLLFVGFSLDDPWFGRQLDDVLDAFAGCAGPHYALVHQGEAERLRTRGARVELLTFEDFGAPLLELVRRLAGSDPDTDAAPPNPFGDQGRITDPERFFDRVEILEEIFDDLAAGRNLSLVGEAQVGKSSVLSQVCVRGPERLGRPAADFVYLNMEQLGGDEDFFAALSDALGLPESRGYRLAQALRGRRVMLCLDELEKMTYSGFSADVRAQLRGLADGTDAPLTLLVASRTPLTELFPDTPGETSPLAPICQEVRLGPFSADVARRFLRRRMADIGRRFSAEDEERLIAESGANPGRLRALAFLSYQRRSARRFRL